MWDQRKTMPRDGHASFRTWESRDTSCPTNKFLVIDSMERII
jgi:hypothetical protein